jgi:hypothetical protein
MKSLLVSTLFLLTVICFAVAPLNAVAADSIPNLLGTWVGEALVTVQGGGRHFTPGDLSDTRFVSNTFTYVIDKQEKNGFSGYTMSTINNFKEPVIGSIHPNGKQGITQDEDGGATFDLTGPDEMNICYRHAEPKSRVAVCYVLRRQK